MVSGDSFFFHLEQFRVVLPKVGSGGEYVEQEKFSPFHSVIEHLAVQELLPHATPTNRCSVTRNSNSVGRVQGVGGGGRGKREMEERRGHSLFSSASNFSLMLSLVEDTNAPRYSHGARSIPTGKISI